MPTIRDVVHGTRLSIPNGFPETSDSDKDAAPESAVCALVEGNRSDTEIAANQANRKKTKVFEAFMFFENNESDLRVETDHCIARKIMKFPHQYHSTGFRIDPFIVCVERAG